MPQCSYCGRKFARNEHLARHQRIHTGERPYRCPHCGAGFQRPDVLAKHVEKLHPQEAPSSEARQRRMDATSSSSSKPCYRERSRLACDQCRKRKLKCDNVRPCTSCRTKMLNCTVSSLSRPPGRPRHNAAPISPDSLTISDKPAAPVSEHTASASTSVTSVFPHWAEGAESSTAMPRLPTPLSISTIVNTDFDPISLSLPDVQDWMTPAPSGMPPVQGPFSADAMGLTPTYEGAMNFFDGMVPEGDLGSWLDDLREVSASEDIWPQMSMDLEPEYSPSVESAVDVLRDQLQRRSRASSPSQAAQRHSWYSAPPQLSTYDEEIVNVLLNVAKRHLSTTFALFSDFEAGPDTRVDLCLAMAAVGGLYCTIPDSTKVTKMLFNDARRLMLEDYLQMECLSFDDALSFSKTFILLEIYGICNDDKRAYEFSEVFHGSKLHAVKRCIEATPKSATAAMLLQIRLLKEAIQILDSYRVLLLQRPPSFEEDPDTKDTLSRYQFLPSGGITTILRHNDPGLVCADIHHLTTAIRYSWMASPRNVDGSLPALWRADFVSLGLDRWVQAKTVGTDAMNASDMPAMLLYHLVQVTLHSNMPILQRLTQSIIHSSSADDTSGSPSSCQPWTSKGQFQTALWHSRKILQIAKEDMGQSCRRGEVLEGEQLQIGHRAEPPHMALCIYFATLVIWFDETRSSWGKANMSRGVSTKGTDDVSTELGYQLLGKLRLPVSLILTKAVFGLLTHGRDGCPVAAGHEVQT